MGRPHVWSDTLRFTKQRNIRSPQVASWIKIGILPNSNLSVKSHEKTVFPERRSIVKHPVAPTRAKTSSRARSIADVVHVHEQLTTRWRLHRVDDTCVHLTLYCHLGLGLTLHAIPSIGILISIADDDVTLSTAINGRYTDSISSTLSLESMTLKQMLEFLESHKFCTGYEAVNDDE